MQRKQKKEASPLCQYEGSRGRKKHIVAWDTLLPFTPLETGLVVEVQVWAV